MRRIRFMTGGGFLLALMLPLAGMAPEAEAISFASRYSNGKICRTNFGIDAHMHAANGANPDKILAEAEAIHDWARFTMLEYGRRWGNWELAVDHSMTCAYDKDAAVWRCRAEAQPCKN